MESLVSRYRQHSICRIGGTRFGTFQAAVADQFHNEERSEELAKALAGDATQRAAAVRLREEEKPLLAAFTLFVDDLRQGPTRFHAWAEVCDRLDALAAAFRRHEQVETDLMRHVLHEGSGRQAEGVRVPGWTEAPPLTEGWCRVSGSK